MSNAIMGTGILLKAGDGGAPEQFVAVAEIVALKPPQESRNEAEVSNHNEGVEAKLLGMLRIGQITGTLNWLPADPTQSGQPGGMRGDLLANTKRNWRITVPPNGFPHMTWPGQIQLMDPQEVGVDSPLQVAFAITVQGQAIVVYA